MEIIIGEIYHVNHARKGEFNLQITCDDHEWIEGIIPETKEQLRARKSLMFITPVTDSKKIDPNNRIESALLDHSEYLWCVEEKDEIGIAQLMDIEADTVTEILLTELNKNEIDSLIKNQMRFEIAESLSIQDVLENTELEWDGEFLDEKDFRDLKIELAVMRFELAKLGKLDETYRAIEDFRRMRKWV